MITCPTPGSRSPSPSAPRCAVFPVRAASVRKTLTSREAPGRSRPAFVWSVRATIALVSAVCEKFSKTLLLFGALWHQKSILGGTFHRTRESTRPKSWRLFLPANTGTVLRAWASEGVFLRRGRRQSIFSGVVKDISKGGVQKVVKFCFIFSKLRKRPVLLKNSYEMSNFKIQGAKVSLCPPPSDVHDGELSQNHASCAFQSRNYLKISMAFTWKPAFWN